MSHPSKLEFRRSSAAAHILGDADGLIDWPSLELWGGCADWEERLRRAVEADEARKLREATRTGAPYGSSEFVKELELRFDRKLESRGRGRPAKQRARSVSIGE